MIANVREFEKKLIDNDLNRKLLAEKIHISPTTLTTKLDKPEGDFKLSEMIAIAQETKMNEREFLFIFFGEKLSFDENSLNKNSNEASA